MLALKTVVRLFLAFAIATVPHRPFDPILLSTRGGVLRASEFQTYLRDVQRREGQPLSKSVQRSLLEEFKESGVLLLEARAQGLIQEDTEESKQGAIEELLRRALPAEPPEFREITEIYGREPSLCDRPEMLTVRQILLTDAQKATALAAEAMKKPDTFTELARQHSVGPEGPAGGLMGTFAAGELLPELEAAALALDIGEVSPVVQSSLGYHIFHLDSRLPASRLSVAECAPKLEAMVLRQKSERQQRQFISQLLQQAKVNHEVPDLFLP